MTFLYAQLLELLPCPLGILHIRICPILNRMDGSYDQLYYFHYLVHRLIYPRSHPLTLICSQTSR